MDVFSRAVVSLWDRHTDPNKVKYHICVCAERRWFLRIKAYWPPFHVLFESDNPFLDHDSVVELHNIVMHDRDVVRDARLLGVLSLEETEKLCQSVRAALTLTDEQRDFICDKLRN